MLAASNRARKPAGRTSPRLPPKARHFAPFTSERDTAGRARASERRTRVAWFLRGPWPSRLRPLPTENRRRSTTPGRCSASDTTRMAPRRPPVPLLRFTTNTTGNSRPFAAWIVIRLTASPASMTAFDSSPAVSRSRCSASRDIVAYPRFCTRRTIARIFFRFSRAWRARGTARLERRTRFRRGPSPARRPAAGDRRAASHRATLARVRSSTRRSSRSRASRTGALAPESAAARLRGQRLQCGIGQSHEPRPQERRGAKIGVWRRQIPKQRQHVLDFVRLEEARGLCRRTTGSCWRSSAFSKSLVAVLRAEQDADVPRADRARVPASWIAHDLLRVE